MNDMGGAFAILLSYLADKTGIYRALRDTGRCDVDTLAEAAQVDARYLREWLSAQAAGGYVTYHDEDNTFSLTTEQAIVLAQEGHPACLQGFMELIVSQFATHEKATDVLRSGTGRPWGEHATCCFCGTDRFFRPGYKSHLISEWIPALNGIEQRLKAGAKVADVGCGFGSSTILMAQAFPNSRFFGFDYHDASVEAARRSAGAAGLGGRVIFEVASAKAFDGGDYDLIAVFDCLHDMGDPEGAASHIRKALKPDGAFMIVEPFAGDRLEDNLNPVGRMYYAASTMICTPGSRAQEVGACLGAQAGEARIKSIAINAGFTKFRRAAQTPFNLIYEARP
jgi:SAM-dependent methyltransferase